MGMLELTYNESSRRLDVTALRDKIQPTYPKHSNTRKESHKNWSPFLFRGHALLIQSINPLVVVNETETEEGLVTAEVVSISKLTRIKWPYGSMRGGTNCILVNDSYYLSFFHSKTHFENSYMATYVMGAYTFSNSIPFQLLSISTYPSKIQHISCSIRLAFTPSLTLAPPRLCSNAPTVLHRGVVLPDDGPHRLHPLPHQLVHGRWRSRHPRCHCGHAGCAWGPVQNQHLRTARQLREGEVNLRLLAGGRNAPLVAIESLFPPVGTLLDFLTPTNLVPRLTGGQLPPDNVLTHVGIRKDAYP